MTLEQTKEQLVKISDKKHELEHKLQETKVYYREHLKTLEGKERDIEMGIFLDTVMKLESAIDFASQEFAKYQTKHKRLYFKNS